MMFVKKLDPSQQTSEFRQYYWSSGHRMMLDLIGGLASKKYNDGRRI